MSEPFVGEIDIVGFTFAPVGYAACDGQLISIAQNTALFSLLGTTYGGDGRTNFALPNLQGSAPIHPGNGAGLSAYVLGQNGGTDTVTLTTAQLPQHGHAANCETAGGVASPANEIWGGGGRGKPAAYVSASPDVNMNGSALTQSGGGQSHNNMSPFVGLLFIIALVGVYPSRG